MGPSFQHALPIAHVAVDDDPPPFEALVGLVLESLVHDPLAASGSALAGSVGWASSSALATRATVVIRFWLITGTLTTRGLQGSQRDGETRRLPVRGMAFVVNSEAPFWKHAECLEIGAFVWDLSFRTPVAEGLSDSFVAKPPESRIGIADGPILNKVRILF